MITLNHHKMRGYDIQIIESIGQHHTEANPNYCCVVMVDGKVEGRASGCRSKREAKETAAAAAVESLGLI